MNIVYDNIKNNNDEYYTPLYAVKPIEKYLKNNSVIWCPFDTEDSFYVKHLKTKGHTVINTHIKYGEDFFNIDVPRCDYVISNPPFSLKREVLEKLFELSIPFAMLVGDIGLFGSKKKFDMFRNNKFEIMYFDKRVGYFKKYSDQKLVSPPFSSVYVCSQILPQQIVFEELERAS